VGDWQEVVLIMAQASESNFGKQLGLCAVTAIVLYLIAFVYLQSVTGESNPGLTGSKILVLVFLFLASNVAQIFITIRSPRAGSFPVFLTNLGIWLLFFVLLFVDALTLHPGIAKDAVTSLPGAAKFFLLQFAVLGLPFILLNTLVGVTAMRLVKSSRLRSASQ
jgi:hypothetical protein